MKETNTMKTAFTLIEILIVVILLGVLAAIVVPQFAESTKDAEDSQCLTQQKAIQSAAALYRLKNGNADPTVAADLAENLPTLPVCPEGGTYTLSTGACSVTHTD